MILDFYVEAIFFSTHVLIITSLSSERISNDEILRAQYTGTLSTREVLCTIEEQSGTSLFSGNGNGNGIFSRFSSVVLLNRLANYSFIFFRHHPFTGKSNFAP